LRTLVFPRDFGAHPDLRTEWWYITGHAVQRNTGVQGRGFGFQLTFFRTRVDAAQSLQSRFAARQLVFAHAAITDVQGQKLWHDQRIAREGFGQAFASTQDTDLKLGDWTLQRAFGTESSAYRARLPARDFSLALDFMPTQPLILQGQAGLSRKGPEERQASYYYSKPQLATRGELTIKGQRFEVDGTAWLDHEWSDELLHPQARGWDWIGMNLDDGSALTAFQLRNAAGGAVWDGGSFRPAPGKGNLYTFNRGEVLFKPVRFWTSPLTQARYPVEWIVRTPADFYTVKAVIDNQELDSRQSTGAVYWEGLSDLLDSHGKRVGRGYLEMTGYAAPLRL
jgi:predicted secreted hydrolase